MFDRAINELLDKIGNFHNSMRHKERRPQLDYTHLFLLDGTRVKNLLDIPKDTCVLLISDKAEYKGIEMEDVLDSRNKGRKSEKNAESTVAKIIKEKSNKFSNVTMQPVAIRRVNKDMFPMKEPVGVKQKMEMAEIKYNRDTLMGPRNKFDLKLPQIISLKKSL